MTALADSASDVGDRGGDVRAVLNHAVDEATLLAAPGLIAHLREAREILDDPDILRAHGARDIWQLAEEVDAVSEEVADAAAAWLAACGFRDG